MLKLYTFGENFGLPDPSPFVMKSMVLLKIAGLEYETRSANLQKAPKGKAPYLRDGDDVIADSTFIRFHLEDKYAIDFDKGLSDEQKAISWAFEKLCEDNLYFAMVSERWKDDANFASGPEKFFDVVPALMRGIIKRKVRNDVVKVTLHGQGMGRHSKQDIAKLTFKALEAISIFLGQKPFLMGNAPCAADASVFAHVAGCLCPLFNGSVQDNAAKFPNLSAYNDRCMALWFPNHKTNT